MASGAESPDVPLGNGTQRVFDGAHLREIAFPIGGIGTGTVSLGGRGQLRDWEIFNRPGKGKQLPYTFFSLWSQQEGRPAVARVLEARLQPPYGGVFGVPAHLGSGLPRLASAARSAQSTTPSAMTSVAVDHASRA